MAKTSLRRSNRFGGDRPIEFGSAVVAGAAANTNITVTGIKPGDQLISVVEHLAPGEATGVAAIERTAATTIFAADTIRVSAATNTDANRRLVVTWVSPG